MGKKIAIYGAGTIGACQATLTSGNGYSTVVIGHSEEGNTPFVSSLPYCLTNGVLFSFAAPPFGLSKKLRFPAKLPADRALGQMCIRDRKLCGWVGPMANLFGR